MCNYIANLSFVKITIHFLQCMCAEYPQLMHSKIHVYALVFTKQYYCTSLSHVIL